MYLLTYPGHARAPRQRQWHLFAQPGSIRAEPTLFVRIEHDCDCHSCTHYTQVLPSSVVCYRWSTQKQEHCPSWPIQGLFRHLKTPRTPPPPRRIKLLLYPRPAAKIAAAVSACVISKKSHADPLHTRNLCFHFVRSLNLSTRPPDLTARRYGQLSLSPSILPVFYTKRDRHLEFISPPCYPPGSTNTVRRLAICLNPATMDMNKILLLSIWELLVWTPSRTLRNMLYTTSRIDIC
jgi:hypothetical protein